MSVVACSARLLPGLASTTAPLTAMQPALLPALGGVLCYRFLRAQGRSRYAGFLAGMAYGVSPWLLAMAAFATLILKHRQEDMESMAAPVLVAKGVDYLAKRIRQIAADQVTLACVRAPRARIFW